MDFLALSQAPPAFDIKTARKTPLTMTPARKPPRDSTPNIKPTIIGIRTAITARGTSSFCADEVEIPTT